MSERGKISIIVPVYQAEKTLIRCVNSILFQTLYDWELILIDDGSTDSSGRICDDLSANDKRIKVFHTANRGVSSARNLGLDNASGEYIAFADADDWLEPELLERLLNVLKQSGTDCAACGYFLDFSSGKSLTPAKPYKKEILSGEEAIIASLLRSYYRGFLHNKLFSAASVGGLRLDETLHICEDLHFVIRLFLSGASISYDCVPLYHYCITSGSQTERVGTHRFNSLTAFEYIAGGCASCSERLKSLIACKTAETAADLIYIAKITKNSDQQKRCWNILKRNLAGCILNVDLSFYEKLRIVIKALFPSVTAILLNSFRKR